MTTSTATLYHKTLWIYCNATPANDDTPKIVIALVQKWCHTDTNGIPRFSKSDAFS